MPQLKQLLLQDSPADNPLLCQARDGSSANTVSMCGCTATLCPTNTVADRLVASGYFTGTNLAVITPLGLGETLVNLDVSGLTSTVPSALALMTSLKRVFLNDK